jgi:hypothetical protein
MNDCNRPFYIQPWAWFLFVGIILFVVFICVIELNGHVNTNEPIPEWVFFIFIFIVIFLFISFLMYYWHKNRCMVMPVVVEEQIINKQIVVEPAIVDDCYLDCPVYEYNCQPYKNCYNNDMVLSDLSPF